MMIGPIPIEMGGNGDYTTGVANVVQAITSEFAKNNHITLYGTNLTQEKAHELSCQSEITFMGYRFIDIANIKLVKILVFHLLGYVSIT